MSSRKKRTQQAEEKRHPTDLSTAVNTGADRNRAHSPSHPAAAAVLKESQGASRETRGHLLPLNGIPHRFPRAACCACHALPCRPATAAATTGSGGGLFPEQHSLKSPVADVRQRPSLRAARVVLRSGVVECAIEQTPIRHAGAHSFGLECEYREAKTGRRGAGRSGVSEGAW